jgi:hypothetical protein
MARRVGDPRRGRKAKAPAAVATPDDGRSYRSRPTLPGPFGDDEPPYEGTLAEVLERAEIDREAGMEPVVEYRTAGSPWAAWRRPLMLAELAQLGLAREVTRMVKAGASTQDDQSHGYGMREEKRWEVTPQGEEMLRAAARGELPMSAWPTARPSSS